MTQIRLEGVGFAYTETLFSDITLTISDQDRLGIVAPNGAGKSTLLKCLAGDLEVSEGQIIRPRGARFGFVEQSVPEGLKEKSLYDVIAEAIPEEERDYSLWKVELALEDFQATQATAETPIHQLSGGWQRLALLARAWMRDPDVLILDEPTNHLDLEKIFMLEKWLSEQVKDIPIICVSHDRRFLDACTTKTLFLRPALSMSYPHPYSRAKELLIEDDKSAQAQRDKDLKEVDRLEKSAHELRQVGINNFRDDALRKSMIIARRAERLKAQTNEVHTETKREVKLSNSGTRAKRMLTIEKTDICVPNGRRLFHIERLNIAQGERVVLLGANGTGKSVFVRKLQQAFTNLETAKAEGFNIGPSLKLGYLDQALSLIPLEKEVHDYVSSLTDLGRTQITSRLVASGFPFADHDKKIKFLSMGERSRLFLLALRFMEPNFYIMDEPTNHLDISAQEQLEKEILEHEAACVLISHDRSFVDQLGTRFYVIEKQKLREIDSPELFYQSVLSGEPIF